MSGTKRSAEEAGLAETAAEKRARSAESTDEESAAEEPEDEEEETVRLYRTLMTGVPTDDVAEDEGFDRAAIEEHVRYLRKKGIEIKLVPYAGYVAGSTCAPYTFRDKGGSRACVGAAFVRDVLMFGVSFSESHEDNRSYTAHYMFVFKEPTGRDDERSVGVHLRVRIANDDLEVADEQVYDYETGASGDISATANAIERAATIEIPECSAVARSLLGSFARLAPALTCDHGAACARLDLVHQFPGCVLELLPIDRE